MFTLAPSFMIKKHLFDMGASAYERAGAKHPEWGLKSPIQSAALHFYISEEKFPRSLKSEG
jgi:hypothetical protein